MMLEVRYVKRSCADAHTALTRHTSHIKSKVTHVTRHTSHATRHLLSSDVRSVVAAQERNLQACDTPQVTHHTSNISKGTGCLTRAATSAGVPMRFMGMRCTQDVSHTSHITHHTSHVTCDLQGMLPLLQRQLKHHAAVDVS